MLTIADIVFNENTTIRDTAFFFHRNEGVCKIGLNIAYLSNVFEEEMKRRKTSPVTIEVKLEEGKYYCLGAAEDELYLEERPYEWTQR